MKSGSGQQLSILVALTSLLALPGCGIGGLSLGNIFCSSNCTNTPPPEFLYATSTGHILTFTIDQTSGILTAPLVATGPNQSNGMSATSTLGFLYVSDFLNDAVDGFSIAPTSGALTAVAGSPFSLGGAPPGAGGLSMFPPGSTLLYATDLNAGTVSGFMYDSSSGLLTPVPGSPFPAGSTPVNAAQNGLFLYVSNLNDSAGGISGYAIAQNGALTPLAGSPFATGAAGSFPGPSAMVIMNSFLYVGLAGTATANNQIAAFAIDSTTGSLTPVPGSPFLTGNDPLQMADVPVTLSAQGFLYTANVQDDTISAFTADDSTGILTPVSGSPYPAGTSIAGIVPSLTYTSSANYFLYASDPQAKAINGYTINGSTGALSPLAGSPFAVQDAPMMLTITIQ